MKIALVSRYPPFPGGRENFVFELANQLSKDNEVLVITPDQENFDGDNLIIRKYPETKESLENIIKNFRPDIVNSHTFYLSKDAADIAIGMNIPFGITLHGDQFAIGDKQRQGVVTTVVNLSDFVINVSENGKKSIINNIKGVENNKLYVVNNGINCKTFNRGLKRNNLVDRKEFSIQPEKRVILIPTRIAVYKGLDFLLDSIFKNKVFFEKNNILFLISIPDYNFSEQEDGLFNQIKTRIDQSGITNLIKFIFLKYEEMKKAYSIADLFLLPSEKEQLPLSILEAMACGIPIITTRVGGVPELLEEGKDAYIIDFGDSTRLVRCIEKYLISKNCEEKSENAYRKVSKKYSIEKITDEYKRLYRKYLK